MESILQTTRDRCFICAKVTDLDEHHCLSGTSNRDNSEDYGLKIYLCRNCHSELHDKGKIRIGKWIEITEDDLKGFAQRKWEETYGTREEFIEKFGKSWIKED